ncbi:MAG: phytanoyl-CoA dioxygenase family protein [Myxococcales bacterium]|nr:phytanoyl-CoA dioxygenase family protein [Myxococcales bacterium]
MLQRRFGFLEFSSQEAPKATHTLQESGYAVLPQVFSPGQVEELRTDIERVFSEFPPDPRPSTELAGKDDVFRYEMLNRSAVCQRAVAAPAVLEAIEPLLGEDCHVIANTAWRNPVGQERLHGSLMWHIDAGPHVPRPPEAAWPDEIPYPVFAVAAHLLLMDSRLEDGPTGVIPGSHRSGQHPPFESLRDEALRYGGQGCVPVLGRAGDVALFVSDIWHRRMPVQAAEHGRFFLQVHYARRDIAQRLRTSTDSNQLSEAAVVRAKTQRERTVIGLHDPQFYDG